MIASFYPRKQVKLIRILDLNIQEYMLPKKKLKFSSLLIFSIFFLFAIGSLTTFIGIETYGSSRLKLKDFYSFNDLKIPESKDGAINSSTNEFSPNHNVNKKTINSNTSEDIVINNIGISSRILALLIFANSFSGILTLFFVYLYIKNNIGGEIEYSIKVAQKLSNGDFSTPIRFNSKSSLLCSMEHFRKEIYSTVSKLKKCNTELLFQTNIISTIGTTFKQKEKERNICTQARTAFMLQMDEFYKKNTDISQKIAESLIISNNSLSIHSSQLMKKIKTSMAEVILSAERLQDIFITLDSISSQANVLALNASVEAVISAEKDFGPSTLAREARMLANQSSESAKDAKIIIIGITSKIRDRARQVDRSVMAISDVIEKIGQIANLANEIGVAISKQTIKISNAVETEKSLNQFDIKNMEFLEKALVSFSNLSFQVERMISLIGYYNLNSPEKSKP